jgi:four helix bundle protein
MVNGDWETAPSLRPHYQLDAWKEAIQLVKHVYRLTQSFPKDELFGLTSQARRASVSVPSNLAEGAARKSRKEFAQFISIAMGSLSELETQLIISVELEYAEKDDPVFDLLNRVSRLVAGLHNRISQ